MLESVLFLLLEKIREKILQLSYNIKFETHTGHKKATFCAGHAIFHLRWRLECLSFNGWSEQMCKDVRWRGIWCMCFPPKGILNLELWKHTHLGSNPMSPNIFPGGSVVENPPANAGDGGSISGSARCPGEESSDLLQCSCLENPVDRGAWQATVHEVAKSWTHRQPHRFLSSKTVRHSLNTTVWELRQFHPMWGWESKFLISYLGHKNKIHALAFLKPTSPKARNHLLFSLDKQWFNTSRCFLSSVSELISENSRAWFYKQKGRQPFSTMSARTQACPPTHFSHSRLKGFEKKARLPDEHYTSVPLYSPACDRTRCLQTVRSCVAI